MANCAEDCTELKTKQKAYISELIGQDCNKQPKKNFNINDILSFDGLVCDCITLETGQKTVIDTSGYEVKIGTIYRYQLDSITFDYFNLKENKDKKYMVWFATDYHIYICEDLITGFICNIKTERLKNNIKYVELFFTAKTDFPRIEIPQQ